MNRTEDDYISLIYESLAGKLSNEEEQELELWVNSDPKHGSTFKEIQAIWQLEEGFRDTSKYDEKAALSQVRKSLPNKRLSTKRRSIRWLSIAAACGLVCACWYLIQQRSGMTTIIAQEVAIHSKLSDGSEVWLQPGSTLSFDDKKSTNREVQLKGSAYFDVSHDKLQPFHVICSKFEIEVIGTEFSVTEAPIEDHPNVIVTEGQIYCRSSSDSMIVRVNEAVIIDQQYQMSKETFQPRANHESWKTGQLTFRDTPLRNVIADLKGHYLVDIKAPESDMLDCKVTAIFIKEPIEGVMAHIEASTGLKTSFVKNHWVITGNSCN